MWAFIAWIWLPGALPERVPGQTAQVQVSAPEARVEADVQPPNLRLQFGVHNGLGVALDAVQIGMIYGATDAAFAGYEAGRLYRGPALVRGGLGVAQGWVTLRVPAHGEATGVLLTPLPPHAPAPAVFVTHVLGYRLAEPDADTLLALLATHSAADEVAACATLALTEAPAARQALGARLGEVSSDTLQRLADVVLRPVPAKPSQDDTFQRVYAVRALAVLAGAQAVPWLDRLRNDPDTARLDAPLQVLRVARMVGSPLETPLAFAIPANTKTFADVLAAARAEAAAPLPDDPNLPLRPLDASQHHAATRATLGWALMASLLVTSVVIFLARIRRP